MAVRPARHRLLVLLASAAAFASPAFAQSAVHRFDITPRSLSEALRAYSQTSGQQILFPEAMVHNKRSAGVRGELSPDDALRILLRGSGLEWQRTTDGVILLRPQPAVAAKVAFQREAGQPAADRAVAPRPEPAPSVSLDEVIVTAQLRDQRLEDVPISVSITAGAALERSNITNLSDLSTRLPNVRITSAPGASLLNVRGVGSGINAGFEQAVGTFVDGVYRGRSRASSAALFDIERVEILRGPQTTFFGNNVIAGALNITTRKPNGRLAGNVTALYAPETAEYSLEGGISAPLGDTAGVRVAGRLSGMDGYVRNETAGRDVPHLNDAVGRASFYWEPTENFRSDIRIDVARLRDRGPALEGVNCPPAPEYGPPQGTCLLYLRSGLPIDDDLNYVSQGYVGLNHYDMVEIAATNRLDLGRVTLTSITGYFDHDSRIATNITPFPVAGTGGAPTRTATDFHEGVTQFSQELRLASNTPGPIQYMAGVYYAHEKLPAQNYVGAWSAPFGALAAPVYNASTPISLLQDFRQTTENYSAFASLDAELPSDFTLSLGLRYTRVHKSIARDMAYGVGGVFPLTTPFVPAPAAVQPILFGALGGAPGNYASPTRTDSKLLPSIKVQYEITPDIMAYVSYTNGFKAGGYAFSTGKFELEPEEVDAYEAGMKAYFLDRRLFLSASAYLSDYKNLQESTNTVLPNGLVLTVVTNAAATRAQGVEFSARYKVNPNIELNSDIAYLDSTYKDYTNAPCNTLASTTIPRCVQDMSGKTRAFAPEWSGSVGMTVTGDVTDTLQARLDTMVYFTSSYFQSATADPLLSQPGYAKLDMRLGVGPTDGRWELALLGKNLTDKKTAAFRNGFAGSPGSVWLAPDPPRTVAIQASAKF